MEDAAIIQDFEDSEDALSFCDLPVHSLQSQNHHDPNPSPDDDFFEFPADPVIISGMTLPRTNHQTLDFSSWRSDSFTATPTSSSRIPMIRSESLRSSVPGASQRNQPEISGMRVASVTRSKKHPFMFGLPKFPPEMQLSDIRRRQSRLAPGPMFTAEGGCEGSRGKLGHWSVLRALRWRGPLRSSGSLGRAAVGCISPLL